jgi:hypothetical protein
METKGDSAAGNSFANGAGIPDWLRKNWELRMVFAGRVTSYDLIEGGGGLYSA